MSVGGTCEICGAAPAVTGCDRCGALVCDRHADEATGRCTECASRDGGRV